MTHVHFEYSDAYGSGSRGSLAFTPHRRHAANETEVLPKPFTVPLLNGEVTVDLRPNPSTWVWIITEYFEQNAESFYTTIPDSDGVIEAVDLTRINPSTIPAPYNAVEPVWWVEMRQYKQTVTDTLLGSEEALTEAKNAIEIGKESIERTQHNASLAKAYAEESREDSYKSRDYRDEAEQWRNEAKEQADRAASGPESAAARAEQSALDAASSEATTREYRNESRDSASNAKSSETSASSSASTATERASDARDEANRAESEANRAKGYADELLAGPSEDADRAEAARDQSEVFATSAESYRDEVETLKTQTEGIRDTAQGYADDASNAQDSADQYAADAQQYATLAQEYSQHDEWTHLEPAGSFTVNGEFKVRKRVDGDVQIVGRVQNGTGESPENIAVLDIPNLGESQKRFNVATSEGSAVCSLLSSGTLRIETSGVTGSIWFNHILAVGY